jgi:lipoprotein-anchoring transpeptidase ErfK/SrfK
MKDGMTRRALLAGVGAGLAGCTTTANAPPPIPEERTARYAAFQDGRFAVPAADLSTIPPRFLLYFQLAGGRAMRYGVGVGRDGLEWSGTARVGRKAEWPRWTPTADMIAREPERNRPWAGGMPGGPDNPLGARALYLYHGSVDTMYRLHGTNEDWSIGRAVSSGCIRMLNHDIVDLHRRVAIGAMVVVEQG